MLIVIVAHADLRDEFAMANEAFALSPIAARAVRPSEADYDAINDAFMETSRGRWFLNEYARRNRNADTRMVLDAVARIETSLAAQKQAPTEDMSAAVADIKALVEQGKAAVASELAKLDVSGHLAPAYNDAQTIRKIVWTLRESGTDLRICDLLDAQAKAIESSLDLLTSAGPREAVLAVFDGLLQRLDTPASQDSTSQPVADTATATITHPTVETAEAWTEEASPPEAHEENATAPTMEAASDGLEPTTPDFGSAIADTAPVQIPESAPTVQESEAAHDEAVLDLIAMEMAVPDLDIEVPEATEPSMQAEVSTVDRFAAEPPAPPTPAAPTSLGAMLLASGTIPRPRPSFSGRFASIRRMSRAEKVALFS